MNSLFGLKIVTSPYLDDRVPKIQVRRLVLSDGTCITPPDFLARENARWLKRFGQVSVAYMFNGHETMVMTERMKAAMERDIERLLLQGGTGSPVRRNVAP